MRAREPAPEPTALPRSVVCHAAVCGLRCNCHGSWLTFALRCRNCSQIFGLRVMLLRISKQLGLL